MSKKIQVKVDYDGKRWKILTTEESIPVEIIEEIYNSIFEDMQDAALELAVKQILKKGFSNDSRFNN